MSTECTESRSFILNFETIYSRQLPSCVGLNLYFDLLSKNFVQYNSSQMNYSLLEACRITWNCVQYCTMLQLLLGPLGGGGGGSGCKGPDSPSENSAVASSPLGLSLSPLSSPLSMASLSTAGPLSPSKSAPLHSRAEVDQHTQSRRTINTPPKVVWSLIFLSLL
jgi:hypothetical protein